MALKVTTFIILFSCRLQFSLAKPAIYQTSPTRSRPWGVLSADTVLSTEVYEDRKSHEDHYTETIAKSQVNAKITEVGDLIQNIPTDIRLSKRQPPKIIIMGGPASGKGTQCTHIVATYGLVHLSTGDMLRDSIQRGDYIGIMAQKFMDAGQLVPDEIIIQMVLSRISQQDCVQQGWLLDGFPRTQAQAKALAKSDIHADLFLFLNVPDKELMIRVTGRRTDPITGTIYHTTFFPPPPDIVGRLIERSDDTVDTMRKRLRQFHANVASVRQHYDDVVVEIEGSGRPEEVACRISKVMEERVLLRDST